MNSKKVNGINDMLPPEHPKEGKRGRPARIEIQKGKSQKEISREYGVSRYAIQSWCGLRPETKL